MEFCGSESKRRDCEDLYIWLMTMLIVVIKIAEHINNSGKDNSAEIWCIKVKNRPDKRVISANSDCSGNVFVSLPLSIRVMSSSRF